MNYMERFIKDNLRYDETTGLLWWSKSGHKRVMHKPAGCRRKDGYILIRVDGVLKLAHQIAWFLHYGVWPMHELDHIDGNPSNNKIENLRDVPHSTNIRNQTRVPAHNNSGQIGIGLHKATGKWRVRKHGKHIGLFATFNEAKTAYNQAS